jgi:putative redox protein
MTTVRCETVTSNDYPVTVHVRAHDLRSDLSATSGGKDTAPGAHDFFDIALATCKAHTAMWYAKRKGIPLERVSVIVESDATEEREGLYRMRVALEFQGPLTDEQREMLGRAASACPITKLMTTAEVRIETVASTTTR